LTPHTGFEVQRYRLVFLVRNLATLYAGALVLLITRRMEQLRNKLIFNNVILVPADKSRMIVAIHNTAYTQKLTYFLTNNQFSTLTKYPTEEHQKQVQQTLRQCDRIVDKTEIKKISA
jgi:hypothetical protein